MRKVLFTVWLLIPVAAGAYHFGPGQKQMVLDEVAGLVAQAQQHVEKAEAIAATDGDLNARGEWDKAKQAFTEALDKLPGERIHENRRLRLELDKVRMNVSELPQANSDLAALVDEMTADPDAAQGADAEILADARSTLANSQYYMTWLMRLEGASRQEWEPQIQAARQTYKFLAEKAEETGNDEALNKHQENLESVIRLARMDLNELQGLPIPSQ